MATKQLPSPELLRKLLRYDPETGELYWRARSSDMFSSGRRSPEASSNVWNSKYANKEAFTFKSPDGYRSGNIFGRVYLAHRVIFAIYHGAWPARHIDHIDSVRDNNRISNLREASDAENSRNCSSEAGSSSRYLGVSFYKRDRNWEANIRIDGKQVHLGRYSCECEAARVRDVAALAHHGAYAKLNFPAA